MRDKVIVLRDKYVKRRDELVNLIGVHLDLPIEDRAPEASEYLSCCKIVKELDEVLKDE